MKRAPSMAALPAILFAAIAVSAGAGDEGPIVVTRDSASLPSGCTPREAGELLVRLADAVGAGDSQAIDRLFAIEDPPGKAAERPETYFRWYSVTEGREGDRPWRHTVFYDRAELFPYFAERRRANERWSLVAVDVGASWVPGGAGIGYTIRREADDLPRSFSEFARGKGEIDCAAQRIYVWSMGQDEQTAFATPCPLPSGWTPGSAIVACTRSSEPAARTGPTARAYVPDFRLLDASTRLPGRCAPVPVSGRLRAALGAFNSGRGASFASNLALRARFHPYTLTERPLVGRSAIGRFVERRYERGDGWTGFALRPPRRTTTLLVGGQRRRVAKYRLSLLLSSPGRPLARSAAALLADCRSGLIHRWTGPGARAPRS